jgi:hypothetical protein
MTEEVIMKRLFITIFAFLVGLGMTACTSPLGTPASSSVAGIATTTTKAFGFRVNFQPAPAAVPSGYVPDSGRIFADMGNGYQYGWNADNGANTRERNVAADKRRDTLIHMQRNGSFQ